MIQITRPSEKPWVICRLGAKPNKRIVARYANRQDADDALRAIAKQTKVGGQFVVAFDVVEVEE